MSYIDEQCRGFYVYVDVGKKEHDNVNFWNNSLYKKFPLSCNKIVTPTVMCM